MDNIINNIEYFNLFGINGAIVKREDIKSVTVNILIKAGNSFDEPNKSGTASLTMGLLNKGTKKLSAMKIAEEFDYMGSDFTVSSGTDSTIIQLWTLKENFTKSMNLFKKILFDPDFPEREIKREKEKRLSSLYQMIDSSAELVSYIFKKNVFQNHPYGNLPTPKSIKNITKNDIVDFYNNCFNKANIFIVFAGDLNLKQIKKELKGFESLNNSKTSKTKIPELSDTKEDKIIVFNKQDAMQTQIMYGFGSINRKIKEYENLKIANYILGGGGFSSRLLLKIRSQEGLTYNISSSVNANLHGGNFIISGSTKHSSASKTISLIEDVLKNFVNNKVTERELKSAISFYTGNIPLTLETPNDIANKILYAELYSLGKDYIKKEIENIKNATVKDISTVAEKYLKKDKKIIAIVANYDKIKNDFDRLNNVQIIDKLF